MITKHLLLSLLESSDIYIHNIILLNIIIFTQILLFILEISVSHWKKRLAEYGTWLQQPIFVLIYRNRILTLRIGYRENWLLQPITIKMLCHILLINLLQQPIFSFNALI